MSRVEEVVAIMFVDIRQSTALVEKRLPYDVVFLLNHFFAAVAGAVVEAGGERVVRGHAVVDGPHTRPHAVRRTDAHRFYGSLGYERAAEGFRRYL